MYRDATATTTPRSTRRASWSICSRSSLPSAIVTTTTSAVAWSTPKRSARAGPCPYVLSVGHEPRLRPRVLLEVRPRRVVGRVEDGQHLARQRDRFEEPVEDRNDVAALVVHRDDDREAQRHTRTASPEQVPDVDDGHVVVELGVALVRRGDDQQIGLGEHEVERPELVVVAHVRVGAEHAPGLELQQALELVAQARAGVVGLGLERHAEDADRHRRQVVLLLEPAIR